MRKLVFVFLSFVAVQRIKRRKIDSVTMNVKNEKIDFT